MSDTLQDLERDTDLNQKKTLVTVTATALPASPWVAFAMKADYPDKGGKQDGQSLKFDKLAGAFDVTFDLVDASGLNLAFYPEFADAIWVQAGTVCPPAQAGNGNGAIEAGKVSDKQLKMTNLNASPGTLTYMLRFTGDARDPLHPPYEYDPQIINGGKGPLDGSSERDEGGCD